MVLPVVKNCCQFPNFTPNGVPNWQTNPYLQRTTPPSLLFNDPEDRLQRGWDQGISDNNTNILLTACLGMGSLLMNFIPHFRTNWRIAGERAFANMVLLVALIQGLGIKKGYQEKIVQQGAINPGRTWN